MNEFKVGDYVIITKSEENWTSSMDQYVGSIVQITDIIESSDEKISIRFHNDGGWEWCYEDGHFQKYNDALYRPISTIDKEISFQESLLQNMNKESKFSDVDIDVRTGFITQPKKEMGATITSVPSKRKKFDYVSNVIKIKI